jgi:prophage regulatory protein
MQLLRLSDVTKLTGLSRATIYRLMKEGSFPSSKRLSERAVAWVASDVKTWAEDRPIANHLMDWQGSK